MTLIVAITIFTYIHTYIHKQNPRCTSEEFYELTVEEDNVRLSTFIKQKGYKFINGLAFYEFTDKEDLHCYKEIVYAFQKDQVHL